LEAYVGEVQSMFDREIVPRNDLLAAQVALADARQNRLRASNALNLAKASYNRRLGEPLARDVTLEPALPAIALDLERLSIEQLIARALDNRKELDALQAQANATGHLANVERARLRPQLALNGGYSYLENEVFDRESFASASLTVSWPLFDGGATRNRTAALRRTQRALEERRADLETLIALETRKAWLDLEEARSRASVTAEAVAQSEENLRLTRRQYQAGLVIITRVLEAESLRVVSRTNRDNALLGATLAAYRLARVVGELWGEYRETFVVRCLVAVGACSERRGRIGARRAERASCSRCCARQAARGRAQGRADGGTQSLGGTCNRCLQHARPRDRGDDRGRRQSDGRPHVAARAQPGECAERLATRGARDVSTATRGRRTVELPGVQRRRRNRGRPCRAAFHEGHPDRTVVRHVSWPTTRTGTGTGDRREVSG